MTPKEYRHRLEDLEEQLTAVYRERRALMEAFADEHPAPPMPPPRGRSDHQMRIARCPRCGGKLEVEKSGAPE